MATTTHSPQFIQALAEFSRAANNLRDLWEQEGEATGNIDATGEANNYPPCFASFDEVAHQISNWLGCEEAEAIASDKTGSTR